ncbi:D,D-heptose 1,7-bisphosphate phosphatase [Mesorhizobium sp. LNHC229A00]|nr:D,D-heptose 1,7-bisphosphate phosphatase [Mesorhizobium sp. LNHC229A00]
MGDRIGKPHQLTEPGLWVEQVGGRVFPARSPALFLDRDGTINVDTDYPSDPGEIELRPRMLPAIAAANRIGIPVVVVTNQSGIARGYFDWGVFAAVNGRVLHLLDRQGAFVDMVLACAYHEAGVGPLAITDHPMRKPNPGMLIEAGRRLDLDLQRSLMVLSRGGRRAARHNGPSDAQAQSGHADRGGQAP